MDVEDRKFAALRRAEAARHRRQLWGLVVAGFGLAAVAIGGVLGAEGGMEPIWPTALSASGAAALLVGALVAWTAWPGEAAAELERRMPRRDREQLARRYAMALIPLQMLILLPQALKAMARLHAGALEFSDYVVIASFVFVCAVVPMNVAGWGYGRRPDVAKYLEDELTVTLRAKAFGVGYGVVIAGVLIVFVLALFRPGWALVALPVLLGMGAATPALWFYILDRRADREDV